MLHLSSLCDAASLPKLAVPKHPSHDEGRAQDQECQARSLQNVGQVEEK